MASNPRRQLVAALNSDLTSAEAREAFWRVLTFASLAGNGVDLTSAPPAVRQVFDGTRQPDIAFVNWVFGATTTVAHHQAWQREVEVNTLRPFTHIASTPPHQAESARQADGRESLLRLIMSLPPDMLGSVLQAVVTKPQHRPTELQARPPRPRATPVGPPPDPQTATSISEFMEAVRALRAWSGRSLRVLEAAAKEQGAWLPRSSLADALKRSDELMPLNMLRALLLACEIAPKAASRWEAKYLRLSQPDLSEPEFSPPEPEPATIATAAPIRRVRIKRKQRKLTSASG